MRKIALVGKLNPGGDSFGIRPAYVKYFSRLGSTFVVTPQSARDWSILSATFDLVVMPGGSDIDPTLVGQVPDITTSDHDVSLNWFDRNMLPATSNKCLRVGICRGFQMLAVDAGLGQFFKQDLPGHPHSVSWEAEAHRVTLHERIPLKGMGVNSLHHQGIVMLDNQAEPNGVRFLAKAPYTHGYFVLEAFETAHSLAVQWHPEALGDPILLDWIDYKLTHGWLIS